jgi:hypothetical protein
MTIAALMLVVSCGMTVAPAGGQQPGTEGGGRESEKPERGNPITLAVDSVEKRTWTPAELRGLATAKWTNDKGVDHPAIPLWTLLKAGGVSKDIVKGLRISNRGRSVTLKGDELAKVDILVLRNGRSGFNRPWRLAAQGSTLRGALNLSDVQRVEVTTTD